MKKSRTIAVVDDDPTTLSMTKDLLEARGFRVWRAMDMMQFYSLLTDDNVPDLIVTDLQMPGGGHQLILNARKDRRLRAVPIIIFSGVLTEETRQWAQGLEGVRCLEKGGDSSLLLKLVEESLSPGGRPKERAEEPKPAPFAARAQHAQPAWAWKSGSGANLAKGRTIAIIDDDPVVLSMTKDLLEAHGFTAWRAVDMMQFYSLLTDDNVPDLIITDMQMPGGGHQLVRNAREDPRLQGVPIIVMSGMPTIHSMKWFQDYEGVRCLEKGSDSSRLLDLIEKLLAKSRGAPPKGRAEEDPASSPFAPGAAEAAPFAPFARNIPGLARPAPEKPAVPEKPAAPEGPIGSPSQAPGTAGSGKAPAEHALPKAFLPEVPLPEPETDVAPDTGPIPPEKVGPVVLPAGPVAPPKPAEPASDAEELAREYIRLMNIHDLDSMAALMSEDHVFTDPLGQTARGRKQALASWKSWYRRMAAFHFDLQEAYARGGSVLLVGGISGMFRSLGPEKGRWSVPCAVRVETRGESVVSWAIFGDLEPVRELMRRAA